jgi:hypothetical protein
MIVNPERITLIEGLALLMKHLESDEAKSVLKQAFIQKEFSQAPLFALSYDCAEINWQTGFVKIAKKREPFCPTFSRSDFLAYFFKEKADEEAAGAPMLAFDNWTLGMIVK